MIHTERIKRFKDYLALHQSSTAFARLAEAHADAGELEKAIGLLETGIRQHPNYLPAHILKARYLLRLEHPFKAEEVLREALTVDPANSIALRMLLELEIKREAAGRGMTAKKLAALDFHDPLARKILSEETKAASPFTTRSVAELYESQGYLTEALRIYKEVARQRPDDEGIQTKIRELEGRIHGT
ncbi:tetratricopeptide repeat protein [candidate division WOR-3 bacterium]|nr:tetratricopeptide repeat protein [candidate division WOR-3 bacterium]